MKFEIIQPASLAWKNGEPYSTQFGDIYFSEQDGLEETKAVFLRGNELPQRWEYKNRFCIAETGFGSGLNFFITALDWFEHADPKATLFYISVEKHPFTREDLSNCWEKYPEFKPVLDELMAQYPPLVFGYHRLELFNGRIVLQLMFGDALVMFSDLDAKVDAWYLDGFAPSKNESMWGVALFSEIARLSKPNITTLATFTVAGHVRRALQSCGFEVNKVPGFGKKKQNLAARYVSSEATRSNFPWFDSSPVALVNSDKKVVIIGAGVAGLLTAEALVRRGFSVTIVEENEIAAGASGNLSGIVMPRLTAEMGSDAQLYLQSFLIAINRYKNLQKHYVEDVVSLDGVYQQLASDQRDKLMSLGFPAEILSTTSGPDITISDSEKKSIEGVIFPLAGWVAAKSFCEQLSKHLHNKINLIHEKVTEFSRTDTGCQVTYASGKVENADAIVIANGASIGQFNECDDLPFSRTRGEVAYLNPHPQFSPKNVVCFEHYVIPQCQNQIVLGADYDRDDVSLDLNSAKQIQLVKNISASLQINELFLQITGGRVAFRSHLPDRLPTIGPLVDAPQFMTQFSGIADGKAARYFSPLSEPANVFINAGHGSRGWITAAMAAEHIAATLNDEPGVLPRSLAHAIHPSRFLVRKLRKG